MLAARASPASGVGGEPGLRLLLRGEAELVEEDLAQLRVELTLNSLARRALDLARRAGRTRRRAGRCRRAQLGRRRRRRRRPPCGRARATSGTSMSSYSRACPARRALASGSTRRSTASAAPAGDVVRVGRLAVEVELALGRGRRPRQLERGVAREQVLERVAGLGRVEQVRRDAVSSASVEVDAEAESRASAPWRRGDDAASAGRRRAHARAPSGRRGDRASIQATSRRRRRRRPARARTGAGPPRPPSAAATASGRRPAPAAMAARRRGFADAVDLDLEHRRRSSAAAPPADGPSASASRRTGTGTRGSRTAAAPRRVGRAPGEVVGVDVERRRRAAAS